MRCEQRKQTVFRKEVRHHTEARQRRQEVRNAVGNGGVRIVGEYHAVRIGLVRIAINADQLDQRQCDVHPDQNELQPRYVPQNIHFA